jgi:hypothetical protein
MNNLNWKRLGYALLATFGLSVALLVFFGGHRISDPWSALVVGYKALPIVTVIIALFASYAWKLPIFHPWLVPFPNLNGTWDGTLQSTWIDPITNKPIAAIPTSLRIKQSFLHISCVMQTGEMISRSYFAGFWINAEEQVRKLGYSYHSAPEPTIQHRSAPHEGTALFDIIGTPPHELRGVYWSSRQTKGTIRLSFTSRDLIEAPPTAPHPMTLTGK